MKLFKPFCLCFIFLIPFHISFADEGMWLPIFLKQLNEDAMVKKGLQIPVDEIYNVNKSSLKDAVVLFGGGCTGELISDKGLLLTNHHCGYGSIQSLSSVDKDYLTDGYWSMQQQDELRCPGLTVTFIIRIEDVSEVINKELKDDMNEQERDLKIKIAVETLQKKTVEGTHYDAQVKPFFNGNKFFLFVTETFKDVRFVGAPPSSIGNFGGDTDNWMWPRHTGDFSLFRIYANAENKPADYSSDNVPFKPRNHFTISLDGVKENDFTMVYGFPGRTQEYLTSYAIDLIEKDINPARIKIRDTRIRLMEEGMRISDTVKLKYSSKQKSLSNAFKKWQGELRGIKRLKTAEEKQEFEKSFSTWASSAGKEKYRNLLTSLKNLYHENENVAVATDYYNEAALGIEVLAFANSFRKLAGAATAEKPDTAIINSETEKLKTSAKNFFKNYDQRIDKKIFAALLKMYFENVDAALRPVTLTKVSEKYNGDFEKYANDIFSKTIFTNQKEIENILASFSKKSAGRIKKDPAYLLVQDITDTYRTNVAMKYQAFVEESNRLNRQYMAAQMEMQPDKKFYPDANSTLRIAYGQVMGYKPHDAVTYHYQTSLNGVMEKEDFLNAEFIVPQKLKELYEKKDFGRYAQNGIMPLAFTASNHTTGGNSGSPVINAKGQLIGTNFDRVWEGTMSDLDFDPEQCRNISVDIRYTLFIIDKFAGCKRLIDELTIAE